MSKIDCVPEMQNTLGVFFHRCADQCSNGIAALFAPDSRLDLPEAGIVCHGGTEAERAFADYFSSEQEKGVRCWHIPHNLSVKLPPGSETGQLYCETHSFRTTEDGLSFVMFCTRADATLILTAEGWKFTMLRWYTAQVFQPISGIAGELKLYKYRPEPVTCGSCCASDHIELQNLLSRYSLWNRQGADALFADDPDCRISVPDLPFPEHPRDALNHLAQLEHKNSGYYLAIPYLGAPVIHAEGGKAEGWWLSHTYHMRSTAFGRENAEDTVRRIERWHCTFVKEHNFWKIHTLNVSCMAEFPPEQFDKEISGQTPLWEAGDHWPYPTVDSRNDAAKYPEDMYAVQSLFPQWGLRLRRAEMRQFPDLYFIEDRSKIIVDIHRRCGVGLENVWPRLEEFDSVCRPKQTTSHNTSTPYFIMNEAGDQAKMYWLDQSWTNMNAVFGIEATPVKFMLNCGMYCFEYKKEHGAWKVSRIWWRVIFRLQDLQMDPAPPCFCNSDTQERWPLPFDTIYY